MIDTLRLAALILSAIICGGFIGATHRRVRNIERLLNQQHRTICSRALKREDTP